jgi:hypothetical protein
MLRVRATRRRDERWEVKDAWNKRLERVTERFVRWIESTAPIMSRDGYTGLSIQLIRGRKFHVNLTARARAELHATVPKLLR